MTLFGQQDRSITSSARRKNIFAAGGLTLGARQHAVTDGERRLAWSAGREVKPEAADTADDATGVKGAQIQILSPMCLVV